MNPNESVQTRYKQSALDYVTQNRHLYDQSKSNCQSLKNLQPKHIRNKSNVSDYSYIGLASQNKIET